MSIGDFQRNRTVDTAAPEVLQPVADGTDQPEKACCCCAVAAICNRSVLSGDCRGVTVAMTKGTDP